MGRAVVVAVVVAVPSCCSHSSRSRDSRSSRYSRSRGSLTVGVVPAFWSPCFLGFEWPAVSVGHTSRGSSSSAGVLVPVCRTVVR
jgi:hypothetical protein